MKDESRSIDELLEDGLNSLNFLGAENSRTRGLRQSKDLLQKYIEEIERFNEAYGLVKVKGREELIIKHILDSLAPLELVTQLPISKDTSIADLGSGAGLPGIPLAICLPDTEFTLIERMGRRAGFLRNCVAVLGLSNVKVEETEMEKAEPGRFDAAVFRAFRPLTQDILKELFRLLKPGGFLAAWKGRSENSREEMIKAEKNLPRLKWEIHPLTVPFLEEERHLIIIPHPCFQKTGAGAKGFGETPFP